MTTQATESFCTRCETNKSTDNFRRTIKDPTVLYRWCMECEEKYGEKRKSTDKPPPKPKSRSAQNQKNRLFVENKLVPKFETFHRDRALEYGCEGSTVADQLTWFEWQAVLAYYNNRCVKCNRMSSLQADHVVPLFLGGPNKVHNIQPLCKKCNSEKGPTVADYRQGPLLYTKERNG